MENNKPKIKPFTLKIATRSSELALIQAEYIKKKLAAEGTKAELHHVKTTGDRIQNKALSEIGGKGLFIKELEVSLQKKESQLAVHSLKDLPCALHHDFELICYLPRDFKHDVMVLPSQNNFLKSYCEQHNVFIDENTFASFPKFKIATGSLRRCALVQSTNKNIETMPIRGNIGTRLKKLKNKECDALILAEASMKRLNISSDEYIYYKLDPSWFVPCTGQGVIVVESLAGSQHSSLLKNISCTETKLCCKLERKILACLGGSCLLPIGIHCVISNGQYICQVLVMNNTGEHQLKYKSSFSTQENQTLIVQKVKKDLYERNVNDILQILGLPSIKI